MLQYVKPLMVQIEAASQTVGKQYILITPQNMGNVKIDSADNKIIRMADPDRNQ